MKLWEDSKTSNSIGRAIQAKVSEMTADINKKALSRATGAVNALRTAELKVLKGQRSGKVYRKPYTGSMPLKERRKKGYKSPLYTASAPGEPPARRTGSLRLHWVGDVKTKAISGKGMEVIAVLESQEKYAEDLEKGNSRMKARPYVERIKEKAQPEIEKIYNEPYT